VLEALDAYTAGSAYQACAEDRWGALEVGRLADMVWLDRDPRSVDRDGVHPGGLAGATGIA
jgi:predicted amidohydrolase YtcJ